MVAAVRRGESQRSVARQFGVSMSTVQFWLQRAGDQRLDRVDWSDQPDGPHPSPTRTRRQLEDRILQIRRELREKSALGEYGAEAIHQELRKRKLRKVPCSRTIHRILERRGALDGQRRLRHPAPPRGWYLREVTDGQAELDQFDIIEGLVIKDGPQLEILNAISLHGGLVGSWPKTGITSRIAREALLEHWRVVGLPDYAQFDNDTVFQGPHQHPDAIGSVIRMCLSLEVTPVFAPPRETGFQAAIESFNGRWQEKVWMRFQFRSLKALQGQVAEYVTAHRQRTAVRREGAPERRPFPAGWTLNLQAKPQGEIIYLRRTNDQGQVFLLGRTFTVDPTWTHRLVRCEVDLTHSDIRFYALRRRAPEQQPLLRELAYQLPNRRFRE